MTEPVHDIKHVDRRDIDTVKWDRCILNAGNGMIYARSFYLDAMAGNWSALVAGDYHAVMPLTWNKKYGFTYLYQPYFTKTLGVFGNDKLPLDISPFLAAIPGKYNFWDIDLNENNLIAAGNNRLKLIQRERTNYLLDLGPGYDHLKKKYKRLANRMIKKATDSRLPILKSTDASEIILLYRHDYRNRHHAISDSIYERLTRCVDMAVTMGMADTYLAKSLSGDTLAYYIILRDERFIYSLLGGSTAEGKKTGAFYLLTDAIIRDHAGTKKIFRFEGSDIPGISFFNTLFGPEKIGYSHIKLNKLPFPFRFFK
jgi:hypothetical protein